MPKRNFETLEQFKANLHKEGATLMEFNGKKVPCILVNPQKYEEILNNSYGKKVAADTVLDIFYDGVDVFVDINIRFLDTKLDENYLLYANGMIEFFESLADSGLMAIAPDSDGTHTGSNIFMVQLPKRDAAENALQIIKSNSKKVSGT